MIRAVGRGAFYRDAPGGQGPSPFMGEGLGWGCVSGEGAVQKGGRPVDRGQPAPAEHPHPRPFPHRGGRGSRFDLTQASLPTGPGQARGLLLRRLYRRAAGRRFAVLAGRGLIAALDPAGHIAALLGATHRRRGPGCRVLAHDGLLPTSIARHASAHPGEGRDPGVFETADHLSGNHRLGGVVSRSSEKTWVPASAGMSGVFVGLLPQREKGSFP